MDLLHFALGVTVFETGRFGQGDFPPIVEGFDCSSSGSNLLDCASSNARIECKFGETAGILCTNSGGQKITILSFGYYMLQCNCVEK